MKKKKERISPKEKSIRQSLYAKMPKLSTIKECCISSGGLLQNSYRSKAWPLILNITDADTNPVYTISQNIEDQINKDVNRSLFMYSEFLQLTKENKEHKRNQLKNILSYVASQNYIYYQVGQ